MAPREAAGQSFPADPPPSLTDPDVITKHDWAAFDSLTHMSNHWDRPGWTADTRRYYWLLTMGDSPALAEHASQCQRALAPLGFDLVPIDSLHVTISRISDAARLAPSEVDALAQAAHRRCRELDPFTVRAVPMSGSRGAIRYTVAPWQALRDLHATLVASCRERGIEGFRPTSSFRPHIGIAYCNRSTEAAAAQRAVADLRLSRSVEIPIAGVSLVELRREDRAYRWSTIDRVALGAADDRPR